MKILRISYEWPPPWDGLAPAPYEMTRSQVGLGHTVEVFCARWPKSGPIQEVDGVKLHSFMREPFPGTINITTSILMFFHYLKWRLVEKNKVDVIHSHGHFGIWIYAYRMLLKKWFPGAGELKTPLVVHFHNTVAGRAAKLKERGEEPKPISKYISWPLAKLSDEWAVKVADAMIFVSQDLAREAIKYYKADENKCYIVESGVNTNLFAPVRLEERSKTRAELNLVSTDTVILNYGVMVERKNIHLLVESLKYLPENYKLLLLGSVPDDDYEYKLNTIMQDNELFSRVVRVGYTEYPRVPIAVQASDVFVLPSEWEGLPKVVLESLASGVPVVASGFKAAKKIEGLVYLNEITPEEIAKKIKEVVESGVSPDRYFIDTHYSWDVKAREVEGVYLKIIEDNQ